MYMEDLKMKTILYNFKKSPNENPKIKPYCLSIKHLSEMSWMKESLIKAALTSMKAGGLVDFTFPADHAYLTPGGLKAMGQMTVDDFKHVEAQRLERSIAHTAAKEKYALSHGIDPKTMRYGFEDKYAED